MVTLVGTVFSLRIVAVKTVRVLLTGTSYSSPKWDSLKRRGKKLLPGVTTF